MRVVLRIIYLIPFVSLSIVLLPVLSPANLASPSDGKSPDKKECTQCRENDPEVSRLLGEAESLYASFKSKDAEKLLLKIIDRNSNHFEALTMLSRAYIDIGDMISDSESDWESLRVEQYLIAEKYARRAIAIKPDRTWGHFFLAASLGKLAMLSPIKKQIDTAGEIQSEAKKAIALDPENGFAYHILGVWNRRISEIGQLSRLFASTILWRTIPEGSLQKSMEYLKKATLLNPDNITHHLELAKTYIAMGKQQLALNHLQTIHGLSIQFSDDHLLKKNAQLLLQELKNQ